jgi:hypothetical protein
VEEVAEIGPAPRIQHAMAFDAIQSRLVLFGGQDAQCKFADRWEAPIMEPPP